MRDSETNFNKSFEETDVFDQGDGMFPGNFDEESSTGMSGETFPDDRFFGGPPVEGPFTGDTFSDRFPAEEADGGPGSGDRAADPREAGGPESIDFAEPDPDLTVEQAFVELERLVKRMETDGISLEESFACYEKGIRLVRFCNGKIDGVEKKVRILRGEGGLSGDNRI